MSSIRVVIAEDDYLVRSGIATILATQNDIEIVDAVGDYDAALAAIDLHDPDVVLTDIRMPPTMTDEGIRLATEVAATAPRVGVVILSQYDEPEYVLALLAGGSDRRAYLLKEKVSQVDQLAAAIRVVADGGSVIDPQVIDRIVRARSKRRSPLDWLTPREREVLEEMARGLSNAAIAAHLNIGIRAVEKHISSIFLKLGLGEEVEVHRRVQAVLAFLSDVG